MTNSLPKERLDELVALAGKATPGKRHFQHWSSCALPSGDYAESILFDEAGEEMTRGLLDADGEFIAALDPDTVRALTTQVRRVVATERERDLRIAEALSATRDRDYWHERCAEAEAKLEQVREREQAATDRHRAVLTAIDNTLAVAMARLPGANVTRWADRLLLDLRAACDQTKEGE